MLHIRADTPACTQWPVSASVRISQLKPCRWLRARSGTPSHHRTAFPEFKKKKKGRTAAHFSILSKNRRRPLSHGRNFPETYSGLCSTTVQRRRAHMGRVDKKFIAKGMRQCATVAASHPSEGSLVSMVATPWQQSANDDERSLCEGFTRSLQGCCYTHTEGGRQGESKEG